MPRAPAFTASVMLLPTDSVYLPLERQALNAASSRPTNVAILGNSFGSRESLELVVSKSLSIYFQKD